MKKIFFNYEEHPNDRIYKLYRQMEETDAKIKSGDQVQVPLRGGLGAQSRSSHWGLGQQPTMRETEVERGSLSIYKTRNPLKSNSKGLGAA